MKTFKPTTPAWFLGIAGVLCLCLLSGSAAAAQSLAAVAKKEADRRKAVQQPAKVYTNEDVEKAASPLTTGTSNKTATDASAQNAAGGKADPGVDAQAASARALGTAPAAAAGDEATWRNRINTARQALAKAEAFERALQSQINGLWADFTARDNPIERSKIEKDRAEAIAEHDRVKGEVAKLKSDIGDIEEEARRAGVPPGWLR